MIFLLQLTENVEVVTVIGVKEDIVQERRKDQDPEKIEDVVVLGKKRKLEDPEEESPLFTGMSLHQALNT